MTAKKATKGKVSPTGADAAPEVGADLTEDGQLPLFFPCLAIEGQGTSDRRTISADALSHRALPISVLAQWTNPGQQGGHAGAEVIGHLTEIWRKAGPEVTSRETGQPFADGTWVWQAKGVADPETTGGRLARAGHLRGNSVDMVEVDYEEEFGADDKPTIHITRGVIAATTLCPVPAFADAYVDVSDGAELSTDENDLAGLPLAEFKRRFNAAPENEPDRIGEYLGELLRRKGIGVASADLLTVLTAAGLPDGYAVFELPALRSAELGDDCGLCLAETSDWMQEPTGQFSPTVDKRKRAYARGLAMKGAKDDGSDASYPIENQDDLDKAAGMVGLGNAANPKIKAHIRKAANKLGLKLPQSLKASDTPRLPDIGVYADPQLTQPTPIAIGEPREDGRRELSGHIASWDECHAGYTGRCVRPPHSRTDYARFATGAARALDGDQVRTVAVGPISMSRTPTQGGHAPGTLSLADTVAYYDNHCTVAAYVAAGEDGHGIWVHGLTRPDLTEAEVDDLLGLPMSGDWRGYRGNLELCGILAVPRPGYPLVRARVASGEPVSLVAAGALRPAERDTDMRTVIREELARALVHTEFRTEQPPVDELAARKSAAVLAMRRAAALEVVGPLA
jgi:hypothetical protein